MAAAAEAAPTLAVVLLCAAAAAFFFATVHAKTADDGDLIAKTCVNATRPGRSIWLDEKFCNSRLPMDKRSAAAKDPRDLALIAMDLTKLAVAHADAKVHALLRSGTGAGHHDSCTTTTRVLRRCRVDYAAVASNIPVCRAMAENYYYEKPGGAAHAANQQLVTSDDYFECSRRLRRNTYDCMERILFGDGEVWDLLYGAVHEAWERTILVEAMLEEMLGVVSDDHAANTISSNA